METLDLAAPIANGSDRYKAILRLALPTVVAMLSQSIVNEIDVVFFSRLPCPESSNGQAALLPSLILFWLFGGSLSAISVGTQALVARRYAEGDRHDAGAVLAQRRLLLIAAGAVVLGRSASSACPWLVRSMVSVPEVQDVAITYTRWRLLGVVSMVDDDGHQGVLRRHRQDARAPGGGAGHERRATSSSAGSSSSATSGAPRDGRPRRGARRLPGDVDRPRHHGRLRAARARRVPADAPGEPVGQDHLRRSSSSPIPAAAATVVMMVRLRPLRPHRGAARRRAAAQVVQERCGGAEAVNSAANTDIVETLKLTFTACMAFGTATATLIGQSLGRKQPEEAQKWGWASVRLGLVIFGVVGLCEGVLFTRAARRASSRTRRPCAPRRSSRCASWAS